MNSRRDFLSKLAAPILVLPLLSAEEKENGNNGNNTYDGPVLRVAIMGLGSYGT